MKNIRKKFEQPHGMPDFPVQVFSLSSIGVEGVTFCNWHSDHEIIYVEKANWNFMWILFTLYWKKASALL